MSDLKDDLILRDWLAIERTKLANERTFLAYFRTFVVFIGFGITLMQFEFYSEFKVIGVILTAASPLVLFLGIYRLITVKKTIQKHYDTFKYKQRNNTTPKA